jgi:Pyruvate/2-oxoacid:ferredoxin oxidoreductase gamma subunit
MLGTFIGATEVVSYDIVMAVLEEKLGKKKDVLDVNRTVLKQSYDLGRDAVHSSGKATQRKHA